MTEIQRPGGPAGSAPVDRQHARAHSQHGRRRDQVLMVAGSSRGSTWSRICSSARTPGVVMEAPTYRGAAFLRKLRRAVIPVPVDRMASTSPHARAARQADLRAPRTSSQPARRLPLQRRLELLDGRPRQVRTLGGGLRRRFSVMTLATALAAVARPQRLRDLSQFVLALDWARDAHRLCGGASRPGPPCGDDQVADGQRPAWLEQASLMAVPA